jgi:hypothetical protein
MVTVTQWTTAGQVATGELYAPGWVMLGGATLRNWLMAGGPQLPYNFANAITTKVPASSLSIPAGLEAGKALIGQRMICP